MIGDLELYIPKGYTEQFQKKEKAEEKQYLLVKLEAPTILYNEKAMYTTDAAVLIEEVNAVLALPKGTKPIKQFINYTTIGGFQVTWGYRKPMLDVFDKGTVLLYEIEGEVSCPAAAFLGERAEEGYGEFSVKKVIKPEQAELGYWRTIYKSGILEQDADKSCMTSSVEEMQSVRKNVPMDLSVLDGVSKAYVESVCKELFKQFIRIKASEAAKQKHVDALWRPTVNNILFLCKEIKENRRKDAAKDTVGACVQTAAEDSVVTQVKQAVEERYGKKGSGKDRKREIADEIIRHIEEISFAKLSLVEEFQKLYAVTGFSCEKNACLSQYIEAYLLELKYVIHSKEASEQKQEIR